MGRAGPTVAWFLALTVAGSGLACTSTRGATPAPEEETAARAEAFAMDACFNVREVDSFSPLHGRFVYVRLLRGEQYLLTLGTLNTGLPFAIGITISGASTRVCSDTGATLTFTEFGRQVASRIVRVEAVDSKETAQALVADRTPH